MNQLGQKLAEALEVKENDINTFVWKGPKVDKNGERVQTELKLVDATENQLRSFYKHCHSMLYNTDKVNPGRMLLLDIIKEQREKCMTELFLRYLENSYLPTDRERLPRFAFLQSIRNIIETHKAAFPADRFNEILITNFIKGVPTEFKELTLNYIMDGCLDQLGIFNKKHITLTFITKLGLWFDAEEKESFAEEVKQTGKSRSELIKEKCGLKPITNLKISADGALNFKEFKAMINLRNKKYSEMTTSQLLALCTKVLFHLENEVEFHATQWEKRMAQIEAIAKSKGYTL